jgi:hypothetical protein
MLRTRVLIGTITAVLLPVVAMGDFTPVGDPFDGDSWGQAFAESGVGMFDLVSVRMVSSGDYFENPTHRSFNASGWSTTYEKSDGTGVILGTATGPAVSSMTWNIWFAGAQSDPVTFDFVAFDGDTLLESARAAWSGSGWTITLGPWEPTRNELVPVPGAVLLGALGLGAVASVRRRLG